MNSSTPPTNTVDPVQYHLYEPNENGVYKRRKNHRVTPEQLARLNSTDAHRERLKQLAKVVEGLKASHARLSDLVYQGKRNLYRIP